MSCFQSKHTLGGQRTSFVYNIPVNECMCCILPRIFIPGCSSGRWYSAP